MAASENDTLGDLGKLPPEIRNEVYKLCLIAQNAVRVARVLKCKKRHPAPARYGLTCTVLGTHRGKQQGRKAAIKVVSISLLYVSKAINLEARSILYGHNRLEFQSAPALLYQAQRAHQEPRGKAGQFGK